MVETRQRGQCHLLLPGDARLEPQALDLGHVRFFDTVDLTYLVDRVGEVAALMDGTTVKVKADAGGLMGCGADPSTRRAAGYIDKDPQSLKPSDLPVEQAVIVIAVALIVAGRA